MVLDLLEYHEDMMGSDSVSWDLVICSLKIEVLCSQCLENPLNR